MASLRGARGAFTSRWHQPLGSSANSLRVTLRPHLGASSPYFIQQRVGTRNLQISAFTESAVQFTQDCLIHMHATGLPWFAVMPAAGISIAVARTPLLFIAKAIRARQKEAGPFVEAWRREIRVRNIQDTIQLARHRKRILRERNAQDWRAWAPALGFPAWLLMAESIRRLCGAGGGLVSLMTGSYRDSAGPALDGAASVSEQTATALSSSIDTVSNGVQSMSSAVDLGLNTGGLLWITDLTAPDPFLILPAALMCTMGAMFFPKDAGMRKLVFDLPGAETLPPGMKWRVRFMRGALVSAIALPAVCSQLPAGLFLYWIPSMMASQALDKVVAKTGKQKSHHLTPCSRKESWILRE